MRKQRLALNRSLESGIVDERGREAADRLCISQSTSPQTPSKSTPSKEGSSLRKGGGHHSRPSSSNAGPGPRRRPLRDGDAERGPDERRARARAPLPPARSRPSSRARRTTSPARAPCRGGRAAAARATRAGRGGARCRWRGRGATRRGPRRRRPPCCRRRSRRRRRRARRRRRPSPGAR